MAGMAALELALQYSYIRQDRSYHFVELLTAVFSTLFFFQFSILTILFVLLPLIPPAVSYSEVIRPCSSLPVAVFSLVALLLIRASRNRFIIEPGEQAMERVNRDILEPCLGIKFDTQTGKLFSDFQAGSLRGSETYYSLRYV